MSPPTQGTRLSHSQTPRYPHLSFLWGVCCNKICQICAKCAREYRGNLPYAETPQVFQGVSLSWHVNTRPRDFIPEDSDQPAQ